MGSAINVLWLANSLWKRRAPMLAAFVAVLLGGLASSYRRPTCYRAAAETMVARPAGYYKVRPEMRRELGLPQLGREAQAEWRHGRDGIAAALAPHVLGPEQRVMVAQQLAPPVTEQTRQPEPTEGNAGD